MQALHAWASAQGRLGRPLPPWQPPPPPRQLPRLLAEYCGYRSSHRGVAPTTLPRDVEVAAAFLHQLRSGGKSIAAARPIDIDAFVDRMSARLSRRTVADNCSSLRCFLRFLHVTGRLRRDLASCVVAPRVVTLDRPPRALPWADVQRILRCIPRVEPLGQRDYAMLLLMATYGLGAAEVLRLRAPDIDWRAKILRVDRPKTGVRVELPLLQGVAKALAIYLQRGRPRHALADRLFVTKALPHQGLTSGAIRHRVREYARRAGVATEILGAHIFRHSHATPNRMPRASPDRERYPGTQTAFLDLGLHPRSAQAPPDGRTSGAAMTTTFTSPLASLLAAFLGFKRKRGFRYGRAEFTLRSFDRFLSLYVAQRRPWRLDAAIMDWLASRPERQAISTAQDLAVIRQFWRYLQHRDPRSRAPEPAWPRLPVKSTFVPYVLSHEQLRVVLGLASGLERPTVPSHALPNAHPRPLLHGIALR